MKILVIQQKMIGDVLTSTIICENIKKVHPSAQVTYLVNDNTLAVVENNPSIDNILVFKKEYSKNKRAFFRFLKEVRTIQYDMLIDVYGKTESNLISLAAKAKTKISYYKWYSSFIYGQPLKREEVDANKEELAIEYRLLLLRPLGIDNASIKKPTIHLSKEEIAEAKTFLENGGIQRLDNLIMISVLGSGPVKTYPAQYMAETLDTIAKHEVTLLFNYIPSQLPLVEEIFEKCKPETQAKIRLDVFSKSLRGFLGILHHCKALIGNEGGAVNMAKALDVPTYSIFSPFTNPKGWAIFEDDLNISVHLEQYKPELLEDLSKKETKKIIDSLYAEFKPEFFEASLNNYLQKILAQ